MDSGIPYMVCLNPPLTFLKLLDLTFLKLLYMVFLELWRRGGLGSCDSDRPARAIGGLDTGDAGDSDRSGSGTCPLNRCGRRRADRTPPASAPWEPSCVFCAYIMHEFMHELGPTPPLRGDDSDI